MAITLNALHMNIPPRAQKARGPSMDPVSSKTLEHFTSIQNVDRRQNHHHRTPGR